MMENSAEIKRPDIKDRVNRALSLMLRSLERMKTGDSVLIYRDPVTKIVPDGRAILVEKLPGSPHHVAHLEVWLVKMDTGEEKICYITK
jgi:hypothetical protein